MFTKALFTLMLCLENARLHDLRLGFPSVQSKRIFGEVFDSYFWLKTEEVVVQAPVNEIITAITVTDLTKDKDGIVDIKSGGVGRNNVTITVKSSRVLKGYKFMVEVFSKSPNSTNSWMSYQDTGKKTWKEICTNTSCLWPYDFL